LFRGDEGGVGFAFLAASALSIVHTAVVTADCRVLAVPDLTVLSSKWTAHFHASGPMPWTIV
jgi:hypothetical protein